MHEEVKILNKILASQIEQYMKSSTYHGQWGFIPWMQGWFNICKPINVIHHINKVKSKIYTIITIDAQKNDRTPHPLMTETL